jgi:hypothetical protein
MEATARTTNRGIVRRIDDRASQREEKKPFSFSVDNGYLRSGKNFLSQRPQKTQRRQRLGLFTYPLS